MKQTIEAKKPVIYEANFVTHEVRRQIMAYLKTLYPIWEKRFSDFKPIPDGQTQRSLLRPVYWLGNWQFACLDYYHPPQGIKNRAVEAESFPEVLSQMVEKIENIIRQHYQEKDIPRGWSLNTLLINYYGCKVENGKKIDTARVGEHKDFEPGPVASVSFGDRALFQFVRSRHKQAQSEVVLQQWLEDSSLQIFATDKFKKDLFHRVQRVEEKRNEIFDVNTVDFETRRINFTFRYVPREHWVQHSKLPEDLKKDIAQYVSKLSEKSMFFKSLLD